MPLEFDFVPTLEVEMITGIQITKADNDDLLHSFWLLDDENGEARAGTCFTVFHLLNDLRLWGRLVPT